jgi:hypothetical protein
VLVADNGSSDGTLEYLMGLDWVTVVSLAERRSRIEEERRKLRAAAESLWRRLERYEEGLPQRERTLVSALRAEISPDPKPLDDERLAEHGATLDWLVAQARTPLVLTLDSDVEFLAPGWLSEMIELLESRQLSALGPYEPGHGGYRARLAPYLLLVRADVLRRLRTSFRGFARFRSEEEFRRWSARRPSFTMEPGELATYPTAAIYPTAAAILERLEAEQEPWATLPEPIAAKIIHRGHMSWAGGEENYMLHAPARFRRHHELAVAEVRERLREYGQ